MTINAIPGGTNKTVRNKRASSLSLRNRLLITFLLLAALPLLITSAISGLINAQGLRNESLSQLTSVAQLKSNEINTWVSTLQINLDLILQNKDFAENTSAVVKKSEEANTAKTDLYKTFETANTITKYFEELFILDENGVVILSTNASQEGKIYSTQSLFEEGLKGHYVTPPAYDISLSKYSIIFSQPIQNKNGQVIGVLAGRANLDVLAQIMIERAGLGETGETYLVGANYVLLSQSRFQEAKTKIGETYIRTAGTKKSIEGQSFGTGLYNDYRNVPVLGSYLWIPELRIALIAEQNQSEALQAINQATQISLGLAVLTLIIASYAAFLVTRSIITPISQLVTIAENITSGNLEVYAQIKRKDEIGVLATAFNTMTNRLRELIGTLEQRVAERTKALATSTEVSRRLSTILDEKKLVTEVVQQIQSAYNYYHGQIYLLDESGQTLILAGATGEGGRTLLERKHSVSIEKGLVGRVARSKSSVLVPDTSQDAEWLPNPLLPDTKAEIAVPILLGDVLLGVIDMQDNIIGDIFAEDVDFLSAIANQVAVGLQNARSYASIQARAEREALITSINQKIQNETTVESALQVAVREVGHALGTQVKVRLMQAGAPIKKNDAN